MNKPFYKIKKKISIIFSIEKYLNNFETSISVIIIWFFVSFDEIIWVDGSKIGFVELGRKKMRFIFDLNDNWISLRRNEIIFVVLSLGTLTIFLIKFPFICLLKLHFLELKDVYLIKNFLKFKNF